MGTRNVGDVFVRPNLETIVSADATTSATVVIASVNTSGYTNFGITNRGSVNIYIEGSYGGAFFHPSVAVIKMVDGVSINSISASTAAKFDGPFTAIRIVAQSASGVYRATLTAL
jgi:hypothetical protein